MPAGPDITGTDIVDIVGVAELLDRSLIGRNGLDPGQFAAQRGGMWTAPTTAAAEAYLGWHSAFYSMCTNERRWLARAIASDIEAALAL